MTYITHKNKIVYNKTHKKINNKNICGKILKNDNEGWIELEIFGEPFERGFAHGFLLHKELERVIYIFPFLVKEHYKIDLDTFVKNTNNIKTVIQKKFPEYYDELNGIVSGAKYKGVDININFLIAWNSNMSMYEYYNNKNKKSRCSAFIATGIATEHNDIVMVHNSHSDFVEMSVFNIILTIKPTKGHVIKIQTAPGYISSGTDFFVCSSGIIGCETTIGRTNYNPIFGSPFFCRIRQAMQYGSTLDDYVNIMLENNAGDYGCSWLFGNINTNEIMLFEIGLKIHNIQRTFNGVLYGMNSAVDYNLRTIETTDKDIVDLTTSSGSRNVRLNFLLNQKYYGKINLQNSKKIISDHYDYSVKKIKMGKNSICNHGELEHKSKKPFFPRGAVDGKIVNTKLAKKMSFIGKWGSSCSRVFNTENFVKEHPKYKSWKNYLINFHNKKWTTL
jgi:hypothetical protein